MRRNALSKHKEQGILALHAVDPGLYSIHPAPLRGKDILKLEDGELVEVPVKANTPHSIEWTPDGDSTAEETVHSDLEVGEGKRKLVSLEVSQSKPMPLVAGGGVIAVLILGLLVMGFFGLWMPAQNVSPGRVPVGTIMPFAGPTSEIPDRWLLCDGSVESKSSYPELARIIRTTWDTWYASGGASDSFRLPDLQGRFLRGVDPVGRWDPGCKEEAVAGDKREEEYRGGFRTVDACEVGTYQDGSTALPIINPYQTSQVGPHSHSHRDVFHAEGGDWMQGNTARNSARKTIDNPSGVGSGASDFNNHSGAYETSTTESGGQHNHTVSGGGDTETRPINAAVHWIIYAGREDSMRAR